jgi:hypothetical protein
MDVNKYETIKRVSVSELLYALIVGYWRSEKFWLKALPL